MKRLRFFCLGLVIFTLTFVFVTGQGRELEKLIYVRPERENLRIAPNGKKIGELLQGTEMKSLQEQGNWIQVQVIGWIWKKSVTDSKLQIKGKKGAVTLPAYTVVSRNTLLPRINQLNLMLVVPVNTTRDELKRLCAYLKDKNKSFARLVIAVYADTPIGRRLAQDELYEPPFEELRKNWLLLYTLDPKYGEEYNFTPYYF